MAYPNKQNMAAGAIPTWNAGGDFANLVASAYTQIKEAAGGFIGLIVNTVGVTSAAAFYDGLSSIVTITLAAPGVVSWAAHGLAIGDAVKLTTTGALPTGLTAGTTYYVSATGFTADAFSLSDTRAHAIAGTNNITTSVSQSGVQRAWDVTRPIGTFSTVAQASLQIGAQFSHGLFAITSGGSPADLTVLYR